MSHAFQRTRYVKASMLKRRVTVHFGTIRVVVPCPDDSMTVADLSVAAVTRYKKATGKMDADVRIQRMECIRDGGILDVDDRLCDVFDENNDQILAIYDEQSPNGSGHSYQVTSPAYSFSSKDGELMTTQITKSPSMVTTCNINYPISTSASFDLSNLRHNLPPHKKVALGHVRDSVVEITSLDNPPTNGLRVSPPCDASTSMVHPPEVASPVRSALRSETTTPHKRVTMSPEVEKKLSQTGEPDSRLARSSARKSRISESFYDAKDRLEEARDFNNQQQPQQLTSPYRSLQQQKQTPLMFSPDDPDKTIIIFPDDDERPLGIEVTGVFEDASTNTGRLTSVQIIRIDSDGRVGRDGRLVVGDHIVSIDGRPVYQMSVLRARAYLSDLQLKKAPTLTIDRPVNSFHVGNDDDDDAQLTKRNEPTTSSQKKPVLSALQQANTQAIGQTVTVPLTKSSAGFGFTVTGRETAKGERLFYIGTVKPNGVALGHLKAGDRLLQINNESVAELTQQDVVERLKKATVGQTVEFLVSRVGNEENKENDQQMANGGLEPLNNKDSDGDKTLTALSVSTSARMLPPDTEELEFIVPLNSTSTAGLGLSLKARVTVKSDQSRHDCGIFIKNVLHNGAAFKDGRLRVDDQIIGIEELNLSGMSNAAASEAVTRRLKAIDSSCRSVRVKIHRKSLSDDSEARLGCSQATPSPISLRGSQSSDGFDQRSSVHSEITRLDESEMGSVDPFDREAPNRRSMSEKRGMGAAIDPSHSKLFQDIKHQRQSSAPPRSIPTSSSFHGHAQVRSASQRTASRARSTSVHPHERQQPTVRPDLENEPAKRRSLSVESINVSANQSGFNYYEQPDKMKNRNGGVNNGHSFRQAVDPIYGLHPYPPGQQVVVMQRHKSDTNKDKMRRKSVGSTMKSWFGIGSKSRDSSPERVDRDAVRDEMRRREWEKADQRRVEEHYERLRRREEDANSRTPSSSRREPPTHLYLDDAYTTHQLPLSPEEPLILSNSRFYASQRARVPPTTTTSWSTDSKRIDIRRDTCPDSPRQPTTTFPVQSRSTAVPPTVVATGQPRPIPVEQHRTTTTCSTRGSPTRVEVPSVQRQSSRQPMEPPSDHRWRGSRVEDGHMDHQLDPNLLRHPPPIIPRQRPPSLHNSTPIAFPTTRFAFASPSQFQTHAHERLSLRARKKQRANVQSMIEQSSPPALPLNSSPSLTKRKVSVPPHDYVSPKQHSSEDYERVFNQWNQRAGSSLPMRKVRTSRGKVNPASFEAITDC